METHDTAPPKLRIVPSNRKEWNSEVPSAAKIVITIGECMGRVAPTKDERFDAGPWPISPSEGLKMMELYLAIKSTSARQAILDALVAIAHVKS